MRAERGGGVFQRGRVRMYAHLEKAFFCHIMVPGLLSQHHSSSVIPPHCGAGTHHTTMPTPRLFSRECYSHSLSFPLKTPFCNDTHKQHSSVPSPRSAYIATNHTLTPSLLSILLAQKHYLPAHHIRENTIILRRPSYNGPLEPGYRDREETD